MQDLTLFDQIHVGEELLPWNTVPLDILVGLCCVKPQDLFEL